MAVWKRAMADDPSMPPATPPPGAPALSGKKVRCPYCRQTFSDNGGYRCPACSRTMRFPLRLRMQPADIEKQRLARMARERYNERQALRRKAVRSLGISRRSWMIMGLAALVLLGIALPFRYAERQTALSPAPSKEVRVVKSLWALRTALEAFREDCGRYPSAAEGLQALAMPPGVPGWEGPYIDMLRPDSWHKPFCYHVTNDTISLCSAGPDGIEGTPDDIPAPRPDYTVLARRKADRAGKPPAKPSEFSVRLQEHE